MILSENSVVRAKDVQEIFNCSESTAKAKIREVRQSLGKPVNNNGRKGAAPITRGQVMEYYGLHTQKRNN